MNAVHLIGRLGQDPELKRTQGGKAVINLRVAVDSGGEEADWFTVVAWEKQAEAVAQYLTKGAQIGVDGRLAVRQWEGQDGGKREAVEVVAYRVHFLGSKRDQDAAPASPPAAAPVAAEDDDEDPFGDQ